MPSMVAISSSRFSMRALASDTATWLANTSSVGRTESPKAPRRFEPSTSVPSARSCTKSGSTSREGMTIGDHHRDQARIVLEALPDQLGCTLATDCADLVLARVLVEQGHDRKV